MREVQPCVYVLASRHDGSLYLGVTSNLIGRLMQHRNGTFGGFTREYDVTRLVWFEVAHSMEAAMAHEKRPKHWRREWKIALIEGRNPNWANLAAGLWLAPLRD